MNVLFSCVGRRVELVQAFKKLSDENYSVTVFGADNSTTAPAVMYCDKAVTVPRINDENYISSLMEVCCENKIDYLIPTIDTDLLMLSENADKFAKIGTKVIISEYSVIEKCRDKLKTGTLFEKSGLNYPKSFCNVDDYNNSYPAFIKPLDGSSSIDAYRVNTKQELYDFAERIKNPVIQPYIDGEEYTIDVFCDFDGNPIYITPRKRLAVRSGEVLKTEIVLDSVMIEEAKRLIAVMKPCGAITVQLIKEKETGINYYIEINPRFGGGAPLSMKAGADSAKALLDLHCKKKSEYIPNAAENHAIFCRFDQSVKISPNLSPKGAK